MRAIWIVVILAAFGGAACAANLYRWVDRDGVVHYGDYPTVEDAERVKINVPGEQQASGVSADIPYEARVAAQHFPVTLYVFAECDDYCKEARAYLKKRKIPYAENVVKTQEDFDAFKTRTGLDVLPALSVGNTWLKGFEPGAWGKELDAAGYPK